jgi:hypothetical protein
MKLLLRKDKGSASTCGLPPDLRGNRWKFGGGELWLWFGGIRIASRGRREVRGDTVAMGPTRQWHEKQGSTVSDSQREGKGALRIRPLLGRPKKKMRARACGRSKEGPVGWNGPATGQAKN